MKVTETEYGFIATIGVEQITLQGSDPTRSGAVKKLLQRIQQLTSEINRAYDIVVEKSNECSHT